MTLRNCLAACALVLTLVFPASSQNPLPGGLPDASQERPGRRGVTPADKTIEDLMRENAKKANKKRQEDLKRDTDRLLDLATELKKYVDKSNENVLSLEVLRKAEEIEKLARSVKDKMKAQ